MTQAQKLFFEKMRMMYLGATGEPIPIDGMIHPDCLSLTSIRNLSYAIDALLKDQKIKETPKNYWEIISEHIENIDRVSSYLYRLGVR